MKKLGSWRRGKNYLNAPEALFQTPDLQWVFRVRISTKEENILKPQLSNKGEDQGDGLKKEKKILEEIIIDS